MRLFYLSIVLILMISCKNKALTPQNYSKNMIILGNGGGFTGAVNKLYILDNGLIFREGNSDTSFIYIGKLKPSEVEQHFKTYNNIGLNNMELNEPGNRYYYITFQNKKISHKIQWGKKDLENQNPAIFHKMLMNTIKKLEEKSNK